jgi:UDP-N-acetylglucosamine--N-acetylmuramyl-(pentapeptide) pyrophosphoryl-undecaprenol N-acetylglucosamine transferase
MLLGGGSGGHVFPLIAVANALKEKSQQTGIPLELMILGEGKFMQNAAAENGILFKPVMAGKLRRYFSPLMLLDIVKVPVGFFQALWYVFRFMPDVVFAKGGYASLPGALVAKLYFIPLFVHESDSIPGLANRVLGNLAKTVFISFNSGQKYFKAGKTVLTGNPVRKELVVGDRAAGIQTFALNPALKTILVLGGSQGAQRVNQIILDSLVMIVKNYQVLHQCGESQYSAVTKEKEKLIKEGEGEYADALKNNYKVYPFFSEKEMAMAYAVSDLIISRAGAGSLFEIATLGKPSIIIPITNSSSNHQFENALEFSRFGAAMIEEQNLTPHIIINQIQSILEPEKYNSVSEKLKTFATPDAADKIASALLPAQGQ